MTVPSDLVRIPSQRPFAPTVTSVTLLDDKDDNEIKPDSMHKSPGIYLAAEENSGKPQLVDCLKA